MYIILYQLEESSLASQSVAFLTQSNITHASIHFNGLNYDTNLYRNGFNVSSVLEENPNRKCYLFKLDLIDYDKKLIENFIQQSLNKPYDLLAYISWLWGINTNDKLHCFDVIVNVLVLLGYDLTDLLKLRPIGSTLFKYLTEELNLSYKTLLCAQIEPEINAETISKL